MKKTITIAGASMMVCAILTSTAVHAEDFMFAAEDEIVVEDYSSGGISADMYMYPDISSGYSYGYPVEYSQGQYTSYNDYNLMNYPQGAYEDDLVPVEEISSIDYTPSASGTSANVSTRSKTTDNTKLKTEITMKKANGRYDLKMSNTSTLPAEALKTAKNEKTDLNITINNKTQWYVKSENIERSVATDIGVITNTLNNIPKTVRDTVTSTKGKTGISIGKNTGWAFSASLKLDLTKTYVDYTAKIYRYDTSTNTLVLVSTNKVRNDGSLTINNINHGGDYIIIFV